jgi:F0F1-type ATP synthase membrane subunit c/vacuolar-type H+-ATPase subunit K
MSRNLALVIIFAFSLLGPCAVFAASAFSSIQALGRNPSSAPKVFTAMVIVLVFAQALAIIAMLIVFQLLMRE